MPVGSLLLAVLALASIDPYQIYARARAVWQAQSCPPYVSYLIVVNVDERGTPKANHYRAAFDAVHDRVYTEAVSEEEATDPHTPDGINMTIDPKRQFQTLFKKKVGNPERAVDYLGVPILAPNYSFGIAPFVPQVASSQPDQAALVQEVRREFNDPMGAQQAHDLQNAEGLKEIGHVSSTDREYDITYDGVETIDGSSTYHLSLRPVHPSALLRLREMWIDTQTYATRRLVTQGNFANDSIPWVVTFARVDGVQYIATEQAQQPVSVGRHTYDRAAISFQAIAPASPPQHDPLTGVVPSGALLEEPQ
jgi:hypothetical protein